MTLLLAELFFERRARNSLCTVISVSGNSRLTSGNVFFCDKLWSDLCGRSKIKCQEAQPLTTIDFTCFASEHRKNSMCFCFVINTWLSQVLFWFATPMFQNLIPPKRLKVVVSNFTESQLKLVLSKPRIQINTAVSHALHIYNMITHPETFTRRENSDIKIKNKPFNQKTNKFFSAVNSAFIIFQFTIKCIFLPVLGSLFPG